jgi:hypothetical protein
LRTGYIRFLRFYIGHAVLKAVKYLDMVSALKHISAELSTVADLILSRCFAYR